MSKTKTVTCPYCDTEREVDIDAELKKAVGTVMRNVLYTPPSQTSLKEITVTCTNCGKKFKVPV
jgi:transcription elongation factor Elf1